MESETTSIRRPRTSLYTAHNYRVECGLYKKAKKKKKLVYCTSCKVQVGLFNICSWSVVNFSSLKTIILHWRKLFLGGAHRICGCMCTGCGKNKVNFLFLQCSVRYYCAFVAFLCAPDVTKIWKFTKGSAQSQQFPIPKMDKKKKKRIWWLPYYSVLCLSVLFSKSSFVYRLTA